VSENKPAKGLNSLERACLNNPVVRPELGTFSFSREEVLDLVADGFRVAGIGSLEEVAERSGAYA